MTLSNSLAMTASLIFFVIALNPSCTSIASKERCRFDATESHSSRRNVKATDLQKP
jgi:hypothetical protein